jgi:hypothetical protein
MSGRGADGLTGDLAEARSRFQAWRNGRGRGSRIPSHLWALAARLANRHGVSRTAMTLGLDYYGLKRRTTACVEPSPTPHAAFVELPSPLLAGKHCQAELKSGSGAVLRLQLSGYEAADLAALAGSFWSAG